MEEERTISFTPEKGRESYVSTRYANGEVENHYTEVSPDEVLLAYTGYMVGVVGNKLLAEVCRYNNTPRPLRRFLLRRVKAAIWAFDELCWSLFPPAPGAGSPALEYLEAHKEYLEYENSHN